MPQVTVYVREDDLDQWKAIEKKSEFIHDALIMVKLPPEVLKPREAPKIIRNARMATPAERAAGMDTVELPPTVITESPEFPPSAASQVIKTPEEAKKIVDTPQFIDKKYSARKPGSKERHIEL